MSRKQPLWRDIKKSMNFIPIKTRVVNPPKDEIWDILDTLSVRDGDIVFITSKILGIHQGRCVAAADCDKETLIKNTASHWLPYVARAGFKVNLTINENILVMSAGIDESNGNGHYILWPKDIDKLCREIREYLIARHCEECNDEAIPTRTQTPIKNLGIVATDSHTTPLRWGVTGIAIGLAGVEPLRDLRGECDIFGRPAVCTQIGVIDALAATANLLMGETAAQIPIVILRGYKGATFNEHAGMRDAKIAPEDDVYQPLLSVMKKAGRE